MICLLILLEVVVMEMNVNTVVREVIEVIEVKEKETMMMTRHVEVVVLTIGILTMIPFRRFSLSVNSISFKARL